MTVWEQIDLMARGGSIALLARWSWILIRDHSRNVPARLAVAMNLRICSYLIVTAGIWGRPSLIGLLFALGAGATPGLFWLFAKAWFNDEKQVAPVSAALVVLSGDCQDFRVWAGIMGKKESHYVPTQRTCDPV